MKKYGKKSSSRPFLAHPASGQETLFYLRVALPPGGGIGPRAGQTIPTTTRYDWVSAYPGPSTHKIKGIASPLIPYALPPEPLQSPIPWRTSSTRPPNPHTLEEFLHAASKPPYPGGLPHPAFRLSSQLSLVGSKYRMFMGNHLGGISHPCWFLTQRQYTGAIQQPVSGRLAMLKIVSQWEYTCELDTFLSNQSGPRALVYMYGLYLESRMDDLAF